MKGGAKKKNSSEAPIDSAATAAAAAAVNASNGGGNSLAPSGENDETLLQKGEDGEETHLQDSEGEGAEGEEGAEEEEEEKEDGDIVREEGQGPKLDDGFYEIEAIRRKRVRKVEYCLFTELSQHVLKFLFP